MKLIDATQLILAAHSDKFVTMKEIIDAPAIDPISAAGGCYCWECKSFMPYTSEYKAKVGNADGDCGMLIFGCTDNQYYARKADDFCSYGQRKIETTLPKSDAKNESLEDSHEVSE